MITSTFCIKERYLKLKCAKIKNFIKKKVSKFTFSSFSTNKDKLPQSLLKIRAKKIKLVTFKPGKNLHKKGFYFSNFPSEFFQKTSQNRFENGYKKGRTKQFIAQKSDKKESEKKGKRRLILLLSGAIIGFLNGFFGGGGGMICVPILQKVLSLDSKQSHATAIAIIFPLSLVSAFVYVINGYINAFPLISVGIGVVAGGVIGAFALKFLPPKAVQIIFAVIMFAGGLKLII